eukprot:5366902-Heterocapsa_arctica.AAC.1
MWPSSGWGLAPPATSDRVPARYSGGRKAASSGNGMGGPSLGRPCWQLIVCSAWDMMRLAAASDLGAP